MTTQDAGSPAEELAWRRYRGWAMTARKLKAKYQQAYTWVGVLALLGAIAGIIAQQLVLPDDSILGWNLGWANRAVAVVSVLCVTASTYMGKQLLGTERETQWVQARGIAEALKSQLYLFWMRADPYQVSATDEASPEKRLLDKVAELEQVGVQLPRREPTSAEKSTPPARSSMTIENYLKFRIQDQIDFYRTQVRNHQTRLAAFQRVGFVLGLIGTLMGVFGASESGTKVVAWVAVVSTAAMGLTSFATAGRHQYIITTYRAAADRLEYLAGVWSSTGKTPEDQRRFVIDAEATLRAENAAWLVEQSTPVSPPAAKQLGPRP